tara:strand:- start:35911 stop:36822 length:912 start_codon:yes stop_codon:yes gene_type:complete
MLTNKEIAFKIKPITNERINVDYSDLCEKAIQLRNNQKDVVTDRCRIGNDIVDYFTFEERLRTKSKYNINYFEFVERIDEFKEKKFIKNMLTYYKNVKNKNNTKNEFVVLKEVFNICIGAINIFRPLAALEIYSIYNPSCVLDICAGWGGRCLGAAVWNVPKYIGIDTNINLKDGYDKLKLFLNERTSTDINMFYTDAVNFDFHSLQPYDMVFTSPPYYLLEKYSHFEYYDKKKNEMDVNFYQPLFLRSYEWLTEGGHMILNVNKEIYERNCVPLFGEAHVIHPLKKSKRQNNYTESIYVWKK